MKELKQTITIPEGVSLDLSGSILKVKGPLGELERDLPFPLVIMRKQDNKLTLSAKKQTKTVKMFMNTYRAHIQNMIKGVNEKFTYKLKICSGHFPMNVIIEKNEVIIKNFLGEKIPRKTKIPESVDVIIEGDLITITSIDKEKAGLAASRIEKATKITGRDRRRFQDGCYIFFKSGKEIK